MDCAYKLHYRKIKKYLKKKKKKRIKKNKRKEKRVKHRRTSSSNECSNTSSSLNSNHSKSNKRELYYVILCFLYIFVCVHILGLNIISSFSLICKKNIFHDIKILSFFS